MGVQVPPSAPQSKCNICWVIFCMQVNEIKNEGLELHYQVIVPSKSVTNAINAKLESLAKTVKMPGFRPGKVPFKIVEQKYKSTVVNDAIENEIQSQVSNIIKSNNLTLATQAQIDGLKFDDGKDLEFKVIFEKMPHINITDFSKYKIEKPTVKISDEAVEERINQISSSKISYKKAAKTAKASENDKVMIDFKGFVDGVAFPGGESKDFGLVLGSKSFIPGFEDQLVGSKAGEERTILVKFPDDYRATDLAGKEAKFEVKIHEVQNPQKLEINDEMAKEFGAKDLADFKSIVKNLMQKEFEEPSFTYQKMSLFNQLEKELKFDVPASMVKKEIELLKNQIQQFKDEDEELKGKSEKELEEYTSKIASRRVRIGLMLSDYASRNSLKPTTEDFRAAIMSQARSFPGSEQQIFEFYQKNPKAMQNLSGPILEDKSVKHILANHVKITEKEYSRDAFFKLMDKMESAS